MRLRHSGAMGLVLVVLALVAAACGSSSKSTSSHGGGASGPPITIGGYNFSEATIVANIYGDALKNAGFNVNVQAELGPRETVQPALESGKINMAIDYVGPLLSFYDSTATGAPPEQTLAKLMPHLTQHGLQTAALSPASDGDAIAVNSATHQRYNLTSLTQLGPVSGQLAFGGPPECKTRFDCIPGLASVYGAHFKSFATLDSVGPITIAALRSNQVQVARLDQTDPSINLDHFTVLDDPKNLQGAGNLIPVFSDKLASSKLTSTLNHVSASITTSDLLNLNTQVAQSQTPPATVAQQFVKSKNLG